MKLLFVMLGILAISATGCASKPLPTARVGSAEAAVRTAEEVGAPTVPDAAMHLQIARDELNTARRLLDDGDYEKAEWLLVRSEADADVAVAMSREATQQKAADDAVGRVRAASMQNR